MNEINDCELILCCICCTNSSDDYFNINETHLQFKNNLISIEFIIKDLLGNIEINTEEDEKQKQICSHCKMKILEFFTFKKMHEETRKAYQFKEMVLKMTNFNSMDLEKNDELENLEENDDIFGFNDVADDSIEQDTSLISSQNDQNDAVEIITKKKRMRKSCPEKWDRNKRKFAKNCGKSYVRKCGKIVEAKQMKQNCGSCRMNCTQRISEEARLKNFNHFYELGDLEKQRKFIIEHIKVFDKKNSPSDSGKMRKILRMFYLDDYGENNNEMIQVCKKLFLNTFVISSQTIATIQNKISKEGKVEDLRGKYERRKSNINEAATTNLPYFLISLK